ncbi:hypothetical protein JZ751_026402, partial [Albula glossodonta]
GLYCGGDGWGSSGVTGSLAPVLSKGHAIHHCPVMCAGHNKWSKVKHVKGPKDAARSVMFAKMAMMIRVAVREGGPNPEFNSQLANLEKAKYGTYSLYEARGPGGSLLLIEVLTDNNSRTHQTVKYLLQKHGGMMCDGALHSFEKKGVVVVPGEGLSMDRALELAVEAGAEDFVCDVSELRGVRSALEGLNVPTLSASLEFVSQNPALLTLAQLEAASQLLGVLNDCPDVMRVWDNIQAQE